MGWIIRAVGSFPSLLHFLHQLLKATDLSQAHSEGILKPGSQQAIISHSLQPHYFKYRYGILKPKCQQKIISHSLQPEQFKAVLSDRLITSFQHPKLQYAILVYSFRPL